MTVSSAVLPLKSAAIIPKAALLFIDSKVVRKFESGDHGWIEQTARNRDNDRSAIRTGIVELPGGQVKAKGVAQRRAFSHDLADGKRWFIRQGEKRT